MERFEAIAGDVVSISVGQTLNMGDFENIYVEVTYATAVRKGETQEQAYSRASEFTEAQFIVEVTKQVGAVQERRGHKSIYEWAQEKMMEAITAIEDD